MLIVTLRHSSYILWQKSLLPNMIVLHFLSILEAQLSQLVMLVKSQLSKAVLWGKLTRDIPQS